jgi:hypothetical protein
MRYIRDKRCREKTNHSNDIQQLVFASRAFYDMMWKNTVVPGRQQMTIWRAHISSWIPKATNAHTGCVIPIAFPLK